MAKPRTKKRTHVGASNPKHKAAPPTGRSAAQDPKSMVIRIGAGEVGSSVSQLAKDVRSVMEPGTASRLKERRANRLRDYVTMTGPLGVTHLMLFSRSESGNTNLRICTTPRGPTLHFRVEKYSLCKDIRRAQRRPLGGGKEYTTSPLLIMNNITTPGADANSPVPKHLESLTTTIFQSMFPRINPQTTPLRTIRRVLMLNREPATDKDDGAFVLNFRHYAITTKPAGISRPLRRLNAAEKLMSGRKGGVPNLGKLEDISDFMIGGENGEGYMTDGGTSGSEMDTDAEVEVLEDAPRKVHSSKARAARENEEEVEDERVERRKVKLVELGPRMRLRMTKVEEGLCSGKILWHEHIHKSKAEVQELEKRWETRLKEKEARRKEQKENVEKKRKEKAAKGGKGAKKDGEDEEEDEEFDGNNSDLFDEMMEEDEMDSEGLAGDGEEALNENMDEDEWEDERQEIAGS
ncbi:Brix-domain-containing protein [Poronia punctata]|nr:Brix-domain-containing protein [Poronia punctata]